MPTEFSKLDQAKLDLIRLKNKHEELSDMTLRDQTQIQFLEDEMEKKNLWIGELQKKFDTSIHVDIDADGVMTPHKDTVIDLKELT